ncbi:uncharacterized protein LOC131284843 [Anopheles ziemanni]|uniref:uncharacterized protein LOC131272157 n=1 Tax=Anopheles coustani TaxID=139045 RepID=UPI002657AFCC|nr:uncharacterized protein LOC131272157 [Anopheles coustani]XP_058169684.1 uncharacterized protein LOC131284843 [Anopheles ziemanni]
MSSDKNVIDESMDDGFPSNFLSTFSDKMDSELQLENAQIRTAQIAQERLKKFNEAWNIPPSTSSEIPSTSTNTIRQTPEASSTTASEKKEPKQPLVLPAQTTDPTALTSAQSLLGSPSSLEIIEDTPHPSTSSGRRLNSNNRGTNAGGRRRSVSDEDENDDYENENQQRRTGHSRRTRPCYIGRSRSPPESRRPRRRRSRTRSRHRSRSPRRARSRSWSRESRSSRSSEREGRSRGSNRRGRYIDQPAVHEAVAPYMMAIMQMVAGGCNLPMQPVLPGQMANPFWQASSASQIPPATVNQPPPSTSSSSDPRLLSNVINSNQIPTPSNDGGKEHYDGTTELFLEGRMRFGQYLREKPSNSGLRNINPKVCERVKEAISILERQETKEQTGKFFFVPPSYYSTKRRMETRSPLICNDHNVLFGLTSNLREAKLCEPFSNVNGKLKSLIAKLGLDEGVVSQQLEKCAHAKNTNNNLGDASGSSRIEAISTLPPKPGSTRVRHVIERGVQTEGYACSDCVERTRKTFVATGSQTMIVVKCKTDAASQTPSQLGQNPFVPKITLENLTTSQIETIEAIVQFIRTRHVTGPVDAVQHALSKDSTARTVMGPTLFQSAQSVMSMMTENPRHAMPPQPPPSSSSTPSYACSAGRYIVSFQQHVQTSRPTVNNNMQQPQIPPPVPPTTHGGRYFQPYNNSLPFQPACYPEQPLSKKAKKRLNNKNR